MRKGDLGNHSKESIGSHWRAFSKRIDWGVRGERESRRRETSRACCGGPGRDQLPSGRGFSTFICLFWFQGFGVRNRRSNYQLKGDTPVEFCYDRGLIGNE